MPAQRFTKAIEIDAGTRLRPLQLDDAEELFEVIDANRAYLRTWLPWLDANSHVEHTRSFIRTSEDRERQTGALCALIEHQGKICGTMGFNVIDAVNRSGEIGYWLSEDHTGRGIATACCRALMRHGFTVLDLNRITLSAAVDNTRSRAIAERLGFVQEGLLRQVEWLYDHHLDHALYAMLRSDFDASG